MKLTLSSPDPHLAVELGVGCDVITALASALERSDRLHGADDFRGKLASALADAISKSMPWELQPPSTAQLSFAASISRRLKVDVPKEAAMFKGAMHEFISQHADQMEADGYAPRKKPEPGMQNPAERVKARLEQMNSRGKDRGK